MHATLYNYKKFPKDYAFPLAKKSAINTLKHESLEVAKEKLMEARAAYLAYYEENPDTRNNHPVFGALNSYEWWLLERKHLNHHFEQFDLL